MRGRWMAAHALLWGFCQVAPAAAEDGMPKGPAEIIKQANEGRDRAAQQDAKRVGETAAKAADAEAADAGQARADGKAPAAAANGEGAKSDPHGPRASAHRALAEPKMPTSVTDSSLPAGTIQVSVRDAGGQPVPDAQVVLGVMASMGARSQKPATTDAEGKTAFTELDTGSKQAYRINVLAGGAKFSSMPFRLGATAGERVDMKLRPTTQDERVVVQLVAQTVVELRDDRLHLTQQVRLANVGDEVFVFPEGGARIALPEGFTAFSWQDQMTDQRAEEAAGEGFRLRGSLPPGSTTLGWTFDLPRDGAEASIPIKIPFRTYTYRVITEAPDGLELRISGWPEPEKIEDKGRKLLFTQVRKQASDPLLEDFTVRIRGIPGPGPGRWFALVLAIVCAGFGLVLAFRRADDAEDRRLLLKSQRDGLLAEVRALEAEYQAGEVGPEYREQRLEELTTRLSLLMREEEALGRPPEPAGRRKRRPA